MGEKSESNRLQSGGGQRIRAKTFEVVPFFFNLYFILDYS